MRRFALLPFLALFALPACKPPAPPKPPLVESVAVLPFDNESNELNAPDIMQDYVYRALLNSPYRPLDIKQINDKLAAVGIVDGGQLAAVDPVKLGKDLGVQALIYGIVNDFGYTNIGYYTSRKVAIDLKMVSVDNGDTIWEGSGTAASRNLTLDSREAKRNLAVGLAQQAIDKATKHPLDKESRDAAVKALASLPGYRFCGFTGAAANPAIEIGGRVVKKTYR